MKSLIASALVVSLAISLGMATVWWTRRTYPGFGYWLVATLCRTLGVLLILPRDRLPAWLTVIVANTLLISGHVLTTRGLLVFRGRATHPVWEGAALLSFAALFAWFTYIDPDVGTRIVLFCLYGGLFEWWAAAVLLTRRPADFASGDRLLVATFGALILLALARAVYTQWFGTPVVSLMAAPAQGVFILFDTGAMLLLALGLVIINAQRIEYDYRTSQRRLEQDIIARERVEAALRESEERLRELAIRDPLTGLFNRRYLDETLPREFNRCRRDNEPLTVAMLDLDHFKRFNDRHGHEAGDVALRVVGTLVLRSLRGGDIACRYGGEELVLVLPGAPLARVEVRMKALRRGLARLRLSHRGTDLPGITISVGLATADPGDADAAALLNRADAALYQAKAQGRDRILVSA